MSTIEDGLEPLPPERRFRLYMRLHGIFREHEAEEAAVAAMELARQAARESPTIQRELQMYLDALREET